jgi:hypothetical protein
MELIELVRQITDDTVEPYLLTDEQIRLALAKAERDFALATLSNFKSESTSITAATPWAVVPAGIFFVRSVLLEGAQLRVVSTHEMDYGFFDLGSGEDSSRWSKWREKTGTPKFVIVDMGPGQLRLAPVPSVDGSLTVEGFCIPAALDIAGSPTIPTAFHEALKLGAAFQIYMMQDTEIFNAEQAAQFRALWVNEIEMAQQVLQTEIRAQSRSIALPRGFSGLGGSVRERVEKVGM